MDRHDDAPAPGHDGYLAQRVHDALAEDRRVGELGLSVTVAGQHVYVNGEVTTEERREAIGRVVAEVLPEHRLTNEVRVAPVSETDDMEMLP
ncbi:MAG: BON domain-containing protein [Actinomycetota bacterium]|nr:BON domain-containing protein [Actinomycetota bacterium]